VVYPGNPVASPPKPLVFKDVNAVDGSSRGVTYNSFILPANDPDIHGELNAWHVNNTREDFYFTTHFLGKGPAPAGWKSIPFYGDTDVWWPFDIMNPDGGTRQLRGGDYVIMKGALWEDGEHGQNPEWDKPPTQSHAGWMEIHPVDWVVRVSEPKPAYRKTAARHFPVLALPGGPSQGIWLDISRDFAPADPTKQYSIGDIRELIDGRFTDWSTVSGYSMDDLQTHVTVTGTVTGTATKQGRFKAAYIIGWREKDSRDEVWVEDAVPANANLRGDMEMWNWVASPFFSGNKAHQSDNQRGRHQHSFFDTSNPLNVGQGDTLFACIYLDPAAVPCEVMLQWASGGSWEHRAY